MKALLDSRTPVFDAWAKRMGDHDANAQEIERRQKEHDPRVKELESRRKKP
jgi:hypothetical protein